MKIFLISFLYIILLSCSFDNKSGIWKSESNVKTENNNEFSQFEDLITVNSSFKSEVKIKEGYKFDLPNLYTNLEWNDIFYNQYNNSRNFKYSDLNEKFFLSKKITKHKVDKYILYENKNIISTDRGGNINVYSLSDKKKNFKVQFLQKKIQKRFKKTQYNC